MVNEPTDEATDEAAAQLRAELESMSAHAAWTRDWMHAIHGSRRPSRWYDDPPIIVQAFVMGVGIVVASVPLMILVLLATRFIVWTGVAP